PSLRVRSSPRSPPIPYTTLFRSGQAIATGRLLPAQDGSAKIGRVAVNKVLRGSGAGRRVMQALMDAARRRGDREIVLHAQRTAEDRKSTRLNSSHEWISYAVCCL